MVVDPPASAAWACPCTDAERRAGAASSGVTMMRAIRRFTRIRVASDDSGVSLLEVVFASAIMAVVSISTLSALIFATTSGQQNTMRIRALDLANRTIEHARNLPYDSVGVIGGNPAGTILSVDSSSTPGFVITTAVTYSYDSSTGRAAYKNIVARVTWTKPRPGSVSLSSAIYGPTAMVNNGDLMVQVYQAGSTTGIEGAVVGVKASGVATTQTITTGADGRTVFGMLPIGIATVSVSSSGWVFGPVTPNPSVVTDVLTATYVYGYRPCTVVARTVSAVATATTIPGVAVTLLGVGGTSYSGTSDANGVVTFTMMMPDSYAISASKSGYADASESLPALAAGSSTTVDIEMSLSAPATAFKIRVTNPSGSAISPATVTVTGPGTSTSNVTGSPTNTPSNGEVYFTGLASGSYKVGVTAANYNPYPATSYSVTSGTDQTLEVVLTSTSATAKGTLSIQVWTYQGEGNPDTNHEVTVKQKSGTSWITIKNGSSSHFHTNSSGVVSIPNLTEGIYQVTVKDISTPQEEDVVGGLTSYLIFTTPAPH
jgi:hypothetical protein